MVSEPELLMLFFILDGAQDEAEARIREYHHVVESEDDIDDDVNSFPDGVNLAIIRLGLSLLAPHQRVLGSHLLCVEIISIEQADEEDSLVLIDNEDGEKEIIYVNDGLRYHVKDLVLS